MKCRCFHPFVPIGDFAIFKLHGMQHAITVKSVITPFRLKVGVRPVADIKTIQIFGNLADHLHVSENIFTLNGRVVAAECWNVVNG